MTFEQSLFISYAHLDNQPLTPGAKGWITRFHATLKSILDMRMGREAAIWRDDKLHGNDVFSDEIGARFKQSAVLVSIVTPGYLNSEWCTREAREFCQFAQQNGGLLVGKKSRVFKIIKTPVDLSDAMSLPDPMKEILGYEFFTYKGEVPIELDPDFGQEFAQQYNLGVAKLAHEVAQLLKMLQAKAPPPPPPNKPTVYLAECSYDRKQARELVEGELKRLGYPVLPDKRLSADETEYVAAVEGLLARCALSIHFVGENYGAVPDGLTGKSISIIQNELAIARCGKGGFRRLIWLPQNTCSGQTLQQAFIDALHQNVEAQFGADLIAGGVEELRAAIHDNLRRIEQPEPKQTVPARADGTAGASFKLIYIICDAKDRKATIPVRKWCKQQGFDLALPAFEGDAYEVRKTNLQLLANCDAVMVFYGAGDEGWKRTIDGELKKMAGYRGNIPLPAIYTYLAEPKTSDKEDLFDMEEPGLIDGLGGFSESAMAEAFRVRAIGAAS